MRQLKQCERMISLLLHMAYNINLLWIIWKGKTIFTMLYKFTEDVAKKYSWNFRDTHSVYRQLVIDVLDYTCRWCSIIGLTTTTAQRRHDDNTNICRYRCKCHLRPANAAMAEWWATHRTCFYTRSLCTRTYSSTQFDWETLHSKIMICVRIGVTRHQLISMR